jgi:GDPmannose 4,6-dehydratase
LTLWPLKAKRDWGFAKEYVEGMWRMLQADAPDTYVLATNRTETVRDFVKMAFKAVGITLTFEGEGDQEVGKVAQIASDSKAHSLIKSGQSIVRVNPNFYRPAEVDLLIGDPSKAKESLGWEAKTSLEELCKMMVTKDLERNQRNASF